MHDVDFCRDGHTCHVYTWSIKFHTLNLIVRSSPPGLETHQVFLLATIIDIAANISHTQLVYANLYDVC